MDETRLPVPAPLSGKVLMDPARRISELFGAAGTRGSLRLLVRSLRYRGLRGTLSRVRHQMSAPERDVLYREWVHQFDCGTPADLRAMARVQAGWEDPPLISVVVPVHETDPALLQQTVNSVLAQVYEAWELVLVDDGSTRSDTLAALDAVAEEPRVRVIRRDANGGIAAATNEGLRHVRGDWVAFLDHDDLLAPHALHLVAATVLQRPVLGLVYSDEDKLDADGRRYDPHFKPDFNYDLLLAQNYFNHLTVVRADLLRQLGGLRVDLDGAQDHDLALRVVETGAQVEHLPYVLYHWRQHAGWETFSTERRSDATAASRRAVAEHLLRLGVSGALVEPEPRHRIWNRVVWPLPAELPTVTAVIPSRDRARLLRRCLDGLLDRTDYGALRVLVVDNGSTEPDALQLLDDLERSGRIDVLRASGPFNYSRLNNLAVRSVTSELVLLLNNDVVVREPYWLQEMVRQCSRPNVGAVGARLLYPDGRVQHAGVILGLGGVAGHSHKYKDRSDTGYFGRLVLAHEVSAVTGACLLMRRDDYTAVGGLDERDLTVAFNDIDLCLRLRRAGKAIIYAPHAELDHLESASRGPEGTAEKIRRFEREAAVMKRRWPNELRNDPSYNPNLTAMREDFSIAAPPRVERPWRT